METEITIALCVVSLIILYKLLSNKKGSTAAPLPPGPTAYPIIGSLPQMLMNKSTFRWIHDLMQQLNTEIACIRLGSVHVIAVTSPELSREILKEKDAIFASRPDAISGRLPSDGYLTALMTPAGDQWKKMRRVITADVLNGSVHRRLYAKRCEESDDLVRYVYNQRNGIVDMKELTQHYCVNLTRKLVFGVRSFGPGTDNGGPGVEEREHVDGIFTMVAFLYRFAIADFVPWLENLDLDGQKKTITSAVEIVRKYQDPRVDQRIEMWQQGIRKEEDDILDILINLKNTDNMPLLSAQEIKAEIIEIMIAAVDNPSNVVEWSLAEMMNQPHILAKACEELDRVVGKDRLVQESDMPNLNYVKACIKETFRLHPLAPFNVPHHSTQDTVVGGYLIPKGSYVVLSRFGLGRNPRVWDEPLKYIPERHILDETSSVSLLDQHELRMMIFSTGRRGCPGGVLGSTMSTMLLARLVQGFSWSPPPGMASVDLAESEDESGALAKFLARATPRLDPQIYTQLMKN